VHDAGQALVLPRPRRSWGSQHAAQGLGSARGPFLSIEAQELRPVRKPHAATLARLISNRERFQ
jgi:hypothetical protein